MIVVVALDNRIVEGKLRPSSDTKTHTFLYRHFSGIGGIVHTHSPHAVAWAQAGRSVPILGTTHADHLNVDIPCTKQMTDAMIRGDYEEETGKLIVKTFARIPYADVPMVLVAGHGPFAWGETPDERGLPQPDARRAFKDRVFDAPDQSPGRAAQARVAGEALRAQARTRFVLRTGRPHAGKRRTLDEQHS